MADDGVEIPIEAIDQFSAVFAKLEGNTAELVRLQTEQMNRQKKQKEEIKPLTMSWTELSSAIGLAGKAIEAGKQLWAETGEEFVKYADRIEKVSRLTGQSAEESSKLVQVADDLFISETALNSALTIASKKYDTSIAGIAKLSDEYLKLETAQEKNAFAAEHFGKNYAEAQKLLEAGSAKIMEMAANTPEGLILNKDDIRQAKEFKTQVDNVSDSFEALKISAGREALPFVSAAFEELNNNIEKSGSLLGGVVRFGFDDIFRAIKEGNKDVDTATESYTAWAESIENSLPLTEQLEENLEAISEQNQNMLSTMTDFQGIADSYNEKQDDLKTKGAELALQKAELIAQYGAESEQVDAINAKLVENANAQRDATAAAQEAVKEKIAAMIESQLATDGTTTEEFNAILKLRESMGLLSSETVTATQNVYNAVQQYLQTGDVDTFTNSINGATNALLGLPEEKSVNLNVNLMVNGQAVTLDQYYEMLAMGYQ